MRRREFVAALPRFSSELQPVAQKYTLPEIGLLSSRSPNETAP